MLGRDTVDAEDDTNPDHNPRELLCVAELEDLEERQIRH